jgi:hypothetical protein
VVSGVPGGELMSTLFSVAATVTDSVPIETVW